MSLNHLTINDSDESLNVNSWSNIACNSVNSGSLTVAQRKSGLNTRDDADTSIKVLARGAGYINNPNQSFLYGGLTVKRNQTGVLDPDPDFYPILTWDAWTGAGGVNSLDHIYIQNRNKLVATFDDDGLTVNGSITSSGGVSQSNISYKNTVSFSNTTTSQAVCSKLLTTQITGASSLNDIFQDLKVGDSFQFKTTGTWISTGSCNLTYALSTDGNVPVGDTFASGTFPVSVGGDNGSLSYECNFSIKSITGSSATLIQSSRMVYSRSADNILRISYIDSDTFSVDITDIDFTFALKPSATNISIEMFSVSIEKMR